MPSWCCKNIKRNNKFLSNKCNYQTFGTLVLKDKWWNNEYNKHLYYDFCTKDGLENTKTYKYTPIDDIKTAYIDPACTSYSMGTVYVDTPFSIKVTKFINKMKKKFMKESFDNIDKAKLSIYEAFYDKQITESEKDELIEILNDKIK